MKYAIILLVLACIFTSCQSSLNGRYVIYSINASSAGNDTITNYLQKNLQGKQYDLTIDSDRATLISMSSHEQISFQRHKILIHPTYESTFKENEATYEVTLVKDTGLTMQVNMSVPHTKAIMVPTQNSTIGSNMFAGAELTGIVICHLTRVKQ